MAKIDIGDTIEIDKKLVERHTNSNKVAISLQGCKRVVLDINYDEDSGTTNVKLDTGEIIPLSCCKKT